MIPLAPYAQFVDNFSDGNLNDWLGDTGHFIINPAEELQLNAPGGSTTSWIYTTVNFEDSMTWEMSIRLDFAPSTSNQLKIYLGLNSPDIASASGYYLEIGASGDTDALILKYLSSGVTQDVASSVPGLVADEPVVLKLRVNKHNNGFWEVFDISESIPELLFTAQHDLVSLSSLNTFGFNLKYTDTRRDKFFFDDIVIQSIVADVIPPVFQNLSVIDNNTVTIFFDEVLDATVAMNSAHYVLMPGNISPSSVIVSGNQVTLTWDQPFVSQQIYTLSISGLEDVAGNAMSIINISFNYTQIDNADAFDILITEVMADPTPVVGLPDGEFIELFNNSSRIFNLGDYVLKVGSSERALPDSLLFPGEYVILVDESLASLFTSFGKVIAVDNFPSLTNSGTTISLLNQNDDIIHSINYTLAWYHDPEKSQGGWSIEMKNPTHICTEQDNWAAANNLAGGTPAQQNTNWDITPDIEGPELISVFTGNTGIIELRFDENIDEVLMTDLLLYSFNPPVSIAGVQLSNSSSIEIELSAPLTEGVIYQLLPFNAYDCLGNLRNTNDTIEFGLVAEVAAGDLLINEVLFNPGTGGSRFIEIINVSNKFIDLNTISIARITSAQLDIYQTGVQEIINPQSIVVFSPDPADILSRYEVPFPGKLYESSLPTWDEDADNVSILSGGIVIDSFTYSADWHHPVIADQNGVSLERVSITLPATSEFNWHSASSLRGYATPTGTNSQVQQIVSGPDPFNISNKHFSPDGDGFKDFLLIQFEPESGNDVASIWVYDLEGREIHQVLSNELIGNTSLITWDGRNEEGLLADMGIYLIFIQLWDPQGNVRQYQESCALVKR